MGAPHTIWVGWPSPRVYGSDVEMVAVGVLLTCEHFADDDAEEAAAYRLDLFDSAGLKADGGEGGCQFVGREGEIKVFFKPVV